MKDSNDDIFNFTKDRIFVFLLSLIFFNNSKNKILNFY